MKRMFEKPLSHRSGESQNPEPAIVSKPFQEFQNSRLIVEIWLFLFPLCAMLYALCVLLLMHYKHTQIGYVMILCGAIALFIALEVFYRKASATAMLGGLGAIFIIMGLFAALTVEIRDGFLKFRFGLGLIRKKLKIAEIESCEIVRNPWYYGWGIHATRKGWVYNVSGFEAVEIFMSDGRRLRIGTDEAELLRKAILTVQMETKKKSKNQKNA